MYTELEFLQISEQAAKRAGGRTRTLRSRAAGLPRDGEGSSQPALSQQCRRWALGWEMTSAGGTPTPRRTGAGAGGGVAQALVGARTSAPSYTDERSSVRRHTGAWTRWISRFRPRAHPLRKLRFSRLETVQLALRDAQVRIGQAEGGVPGSDPWRGRSRSGGGLRNADAPPVRRRVRGGHSPNWCLRAPERDEKRLPTASGPRGCPKGARC